MRPIAHRIIPVLGLCASLVTPLVAHAEEADEEPYTIVYGARPITLNAGQFAGALALDFIKPGSGADLAIDADIALDYGVIKNLTVGVEANFGLSPKSDLRNPTLYGLYRFLRGATPVELGVILEATFPVEDGTHFGLAPGIVGSWQINPAAKLEFGVKLGLTFSDPLGKELAVPLALAISFTRNIFFQLDTGLFLPDFKSDLLIVPVGVRFGYTLPKNDDSPLLDLYVGFSFPSFLGPKLDLTNGTSSTGVNTDFWEIAVGGRFFY
ncbi:MAG: hypothetical protein U1F43_30620 [Myxococcota bacterium]